MKNQVFKARVTSPAATTVAKVARLAKVKELSKHTLHLHLKETEWKIDNRNANKVEIRLRYRRESPLCQARPRDLTVA